MTLAVVRTARWLVRFRCTVWAVAPEVTFYAAPDGDHLPLSMQPELASWDRAGSPSQVRLAAYLDHVRHVVGPELARVDGPVSLRLDVGLAQSASLLDERDLDNYLFPLMVALDRPRGRITSVWGTKRHADTSFVTVGSARVGAEDRDWPVTTDAGDRGVGVEYGLQGADPSAAARRCGVAAGTGGPAGRATASDRAGIGRTCGSPQSTPSTRLLGRTRPDRPWHPLDGRIVSLGLHCTTDPTMGNPVRISIRAAPSQHEQQ